MMIRCIVWMSLIESPSERLLIQGAGEFDTAFYAVQALELAAGATNIMLLGLNMRDGLKMTGRFRSKSA